MEQSAALNPGWRKSSYSNGGSANCVEVGVIPWRKSSHSSNGGTACVEVGAIPWRKSSYSGNGGSDCVEAGHIPSAVVVRDTRQDGTGPVLRVTPAAWSNFTASLKG